MTKPIHPPDRLTDAAAEEALSVERAAVARILGLDP